MLIYCRRFEIQHNSDFSLNLCHNQIGNKGDKAIAHMLTNNTTLTSLDLSENYIEVEGVKCIADALASNTTLTSLKLSLNYIGDEGILLFETQLNRDIKFYIREVNEMVKQYQRTEN